MTPRLGNAPLVVTRVEALAADRGNDPLFDARAALKGAVSVCNSARATYNATEREVERVRALVKRLERQ